MLSAYAGRYIETVLTYQGRSNEKQTDGAGKEFYPPVPRSVKAFLKMPKAPNVQAKIGADTVLVAYEGRLTNPSQPPPDLATGTVVEFEMDGRQIKGQIVLFAPSPLPNLDALQGRKIGVTANG